MSKEYLEKDFDPNSSTVVQLKSILSANDVHTGHNPKKADLVEAFNQLVKPKVEEIKAKLEEEENNDDYFNGKVNGNASSSSQNTSSSRRVSLILFNLLFILNILFFLYLF
jgi:cytochrome b